MAFATKKVVTAVAWGLAFDSVAEMISAGVYGGCYGWWGARQLNKGRTVDEIIASDTGTSAKWLTIVPLVAGVIGLSLGLMGLLPGTDDKSPD